MATTDLLAHISKLREQQKAFRKTMKERKTKIRKFMLLINNMLNDNDEGFGHLEVALKEIERKIRISIDLKSPEKIQNKSLQVSVRSPRKIKRVQILTLKGSLLKSNNRREEIIVPETLAIELEPDEVDVEQNNASAITVIPETQLLADETCFSDDDLHSTENIPNKLLPDKSSINCDQNQSTSTSTLSSTRSASSIQHDNELSDETYQLLNELMNTADGSKRSVKIIKSPHKQRACKRRRIDEVDTLEEDGCSSPILVKDVQVVVENEKSQEKQKVKWPIGYKKKSCHGELVVEPATPNGKPFRIRQTKLDGFLAKQVARSRHSQSHSQRSQERLRRQQRADRKPSPSPSPSLSLEDVRPAELQQSLELEVKLSALPNPKPKAVRRAVDHSFDMLPPPSPSKLSTKRKGSITVVKREPGLGHYGCRDCQQILARKNLTHEELIPRLRALCDHLPDKPPMETPPKYWNMSFATSSLDVS